MSTLSGDTAPTILLVDNGSLEAAATLSLRRIAASLATELGRPVEPVSLLHSSTVPAAELEGRPAEILEPALARRAAEGRSEFLLVPLFFGPSGALTQYIPERVASLRSRHPQLRIRIAPPLADSRTNSEDRIAAMLEDRVREHLAAAGEKPAVIVADHGSPVPEVTAVRNAVAACLKARLGDAVRAVEPASMERRHGPDYDFCDPLLARLLDRPGFNAGTVIVAMMFISPGRHAGPHGDVSQICDAARQRNPRLKTVITELLGTHPQLVPLLAERVRTALGGVKSG